MNSIYTQSRYNQTTDHTHNNAQDLVAFGHSQGWNFPVLGYAPIPNEPVLINDWLIVPVHLDNTQLPSRARQKMDAIIAAGFHPKTWFIIHEAPQQLPEYIQSIDDFSDTRWFTPKIRNGLKTVLKVSGAVVGGIGLITGAFVLIFVAAAIAVPAFLIAGAILVDPILIAVSEDGLWIEIDRWDA